MPTGERVVPLRLQKFLARAGVASRRGSENLMTAGRVTVNGRTVTELGSKVDPLVDTVCVDGREVRRGAASVTVMLHKPAGVITTMSDQVGRACVASFVPCELYPGLYPIGRLDSDTTGLLLFSTDGELGHGLLHPRHHVLKRYIACVEGAPSVRALERLRCGVELDDGPTQPAEVELLEGDKSARAAALLVMPSAAAKTPALRREARLRERDLRFSYVRIGLREGRYHQVKRMLAAVGHPVWALHRSEFGPLSLGSLARGAWRLLDGSEAAALHEAATATRS